MISSNNDNVTQILSIKDKNLTLLSTYHKRILAWVFPAYIYGAKTVYTNTL